MSDETKGQPMEPAYDRSILDRWLDGGLCHGSGDGKKTVCLEQAVALCAGLALTDEPGSCVAPAASAFGRRLNDRAWSSPAARSAGLRELAYAQLGTAGKLDERKWVKRVAELIIREVVPLVFREVAALPKLAEHREALEAAALKCEAKGTEASAREAREIAYAAAAAAADAADAHADAHAYAAAAAAAAAASVPAADAHAAAAAAADAADAHADAHAYAAAAAAAAAASVPAADAHADADAYAAAAAAAAAADAYAAAAAAAAAADAADAHADAHAYAAAAAAAAAANAAAAAAYAAANAAAAAAARSKARDETLAMVANIGARAIREQTDVQP